MAKKIKRGRPPFPKGRARTHGVRIRLTRAEHEAMEHEASRAGQTISDWVRDRLKLNKLVEN